MPELSRHPCRLTARQLIDHYATHGQTGLSKAIVSNRQATFGPNTLPLNQTTSLFRLYLRQFASPLIFILFLAALCTWVIGDAIDAAVILGVVIFNSLIGFFQESRAEKKIASLQTYLAPTAKVIRAGQLQKIDASEVVPGDLIVVEAGDRVPADARMIESYQLRANEVSFTGEAEPTLKHADKLELCDTISQQKNLIFMGTTITSGSGKAIVTQIGMSTELGKISHLLATAQEPHTPLEQTMQQLSNRILAVILAGIFLIFSLGILTAHPTIEMIELGVSLAVSAIPEGLPIVITVTLSIGLWRMAQQKAVVRKLDAVETLGSVDIICTDKTGTLTQGKMMVGALFLPKKRAITVTGQGYQPTGTFLEANRPLTPQTSPELLAITQAALISTTSDLHQDDRGQLQPVGDPTEVALFVLAQKAGHNRTKLNQAYPLEHFQPFDQELRYSVTVVKTPDQKYLTVVKGSPEAVVTHATPHGRWALTQAQKAAEDGYRVITLASHLSTTNPTSLITKHRLPSLTVLANIGMHDPLRPDTIQAVAACRASNIEVVMITGDHLKTAEHIGRQLGFTAHTAISGEKLATTNDTQLRQALKKYSLIARATPALKMRLVQLLQKQRQVVAMTGDGVNDGPALKQADVGIAMGQTGSDVALSAADMVLTDDNFASIVKAIEQGRVVWHNLRKVVFYLISTSAAEIFIILYSLLLQLPLPLLATQILWLNLVTDGFLDMSLATEQAESDVMKAPPRSKRQPLLDRPLLSRLVFMALWMALTSLAFFIHELSSGEPLEKARTMVLLNLAAIQWFNAFNARSESKMLWQFPIFGNRSLWLAVAVCITLQAAVIYWPPLQFVFQTTPLTTQDWLLACGVAASVLVGDTIWKIMAQVYNKHRLVFQRKLR